MSSHRELHERACPLLDAAIDPTHRSKRQSSVQHRRICYRNAHSARCIEVGTSQCAPPGVRRPPPGSTWAAALLFLIRHVRNRRGVHGELVGSHPVMRAREAAEPVHAGFGEFEVVDIVVLIGSFGVGGFQGGRRSFAGRDQRMSLESGLQHVLGSTQPTTHRGQPVPHRPLARVRRALRRSACLPGDLVFGSLVSVTAVPSANPQTGQHRRPTGIYTGFLTLPR